MRSIPTVVLILLLLFSGSLAIRNHAAQRQINLVGPAEEVSFGTLINAPNGHISFQKHPHGFRLWVPGRLNTAPNHHDEGGFLFDVTNWSYDVLNQAQPTLSLGHKVDENNPDCGSYDFDRNYAALNAVVPGAAPGTLLGFYDGEYHRECPNGEPLLSSIGIATSTDGGVTWQHRKQIIQGLDEATLTTQTVTCAQHDAFNDQTNPHVIDSGASGPSVVEREADDETYLYLYYADRTPLTGGRDSIYVARALLASDGQPGNWQKWNGSAWGAVGDQTAAASIVRPPAGAVLALQPHVSWNTTLREWLMVFKTANDFQVTTSSDGLNWDPPTSLVSFDPQEIALFGFPTFISTNGGACDGCEDQSDQNPSSLLKSRRDASQQVTGANGYLYYSSVAKDEVRYKGHRVAFRITGN